MRILSVVRPVVVATAYCLLCRGAQAALIIAPNSGTTQGVTNDTFDVSQGTVVTSSSPTINNDFAARKMLGFADGNGEGDTMIFADGHSGGFVDSVTFQTPNWIDLNSFVLRVAQDGATSARSAASFKLSASGDGTNFTTVFDTTTSTPSLSNYNTNFGSGSLQISGSVAVSSVKFFRFESTETNPSSNGPRVIELDGFGANAVNPTFVVDKVLLNNTTNGVGDQLPGHVNSVVASSALNFGTPDDPKEAFGKETGPIEPGTFLFADTGHPTTGNLLTFTTNTPVTLAGLEIDGGGGGGDDPRRIGAVSISADLDNNGSFETLLYSSASFFQNLNNDLFFTGGSITASRFQVSFDGIDNDGPRIREIDAIVSIPEPTSLAALASMGLLLAARRRRA
jgi:hypothetical protein